MSSLSEEFKLQCLEQVKGMGFSQDQALTALQMADYDVNRAADLIVHGGLLDNDNEFDLIAAADPEPKVRKPTVFGTRASQEKTSKNSSVSSSIGGDDVAEYEDSRISSLKEMGFSSQEVVDALIDCNDDVNEALNLLLSRKK